MMKNKQNRTELCKHVKGFEDRMTWLMAQVHETMMLFTVLQIIQSLAVTPRTNIWNTDSPHWKRECCNMKLGL